MEGSQMTGINLRVATLKNAKLKNCNLRGATLAGTDLEVTNRSVSESFSSLACLLVVFTLMFLWNRTVTCPAVTSRRRTCGAQTWRGPFLRRCWHHCTCPRVSDSRLCSPLHRAALIENLPANLMTVMWPYACWYYLFICCLKNIYFDVLLYYGWCLLYFSMHVMWLAILCITFVQSFYMCHCWSVNWTSEICGIAFDSDLGMWLFCECAILYLFIRASFTLFCSFHCYMAFSGLCLHAKRKTSARNLLVLCHQPCQDPIKSNTGDSKRSLVF